MRQIHICYLLLSLIGCIAANTLHVRTSISTRVHPALQKRGQKSDGEKGGLKTSIHIPSRILSEKPSTLQTTLPPTTASDNSDDSSPITHTVVRSQPVFIPSSTEYPIHVGEVPNPTRSGIGGLYYNYDELSDVDKDVQASRKFTVSTPTPSPVSTTTGKTTTMRSFWNSNKKQRPQKHTFGYHRQVGSTGEQHTSTKPESLGTTASSILQDDAPKTTVAMTQSSTTDDNSNSNSNAKLVKGNTSNENFAEKKSTSNKELKSDLKTLTGRVGELPMQNPLLFQSPLSPQASVVPQGQMNFQFGSHLGNVPRSSKFDSTMNNVRFVDNVSPSQRQLPLNNFDRVPQNSANSFQPFLSVSPQVTNTRDVGGSSNILPASNTQNNLSNRLGTVGLNLGATGAGLGIKLPGLSPGVGPGFTLNLGPVSDPLTLILKLLANIPKPLLNLNSRLIFGIELGNNIGLTSGTQKLAG